MVVMAQLSRIRKEVESFDWIFGWGFVEFR
jgi:hypothetical protein